MGKGAAGIGVDARLACLMPGDSATSTPISDAVTTTACALDLMSNAQWIATQKLLLLVHFQCHNQNLRQRIYIGSSAGRSAVSSPSQNPEQMF